MQFKLRKISIAGSLIIMAILTLSIRLSLPDIIFDPFHKTFNDEVFYSPGLVLLGSFYCSDGESISKSEA